MKHPKCRLCGKEHRLGPCPDFATTKAECRECARKAARIADLEERVAALQASMAEMIEAKRAAKRKAMQAYRLRKRGARSST